MVSDENMNWEYEGGPPDPPIPLVICVRALDGACKIDLCLHHTPHQKEEEFYACGKGTCADTKLEVYCTEWRK